MTRISDALAAMDKATPRPWESCDENGDLITATRNGKWFHVADARGWGTLEKESQKGCDELSANIALIAAAPDMAAWIEKALPWIGVAREQVQEFIDMIQDVEEMQGSEELEHSKQKLVELDALLAEAKGEGK